MMLQPGFISHFPNRLERQIRIELDNEHLYILSMATNKFTDERIYYTYSLYDGNKTLFSGDQLSCPIEWKALSIKVIHCLLDFLTQESSKWPSESDCEEISIYLYDLE